MDEIREALACLIRAGLQAKELDEKLIECGYGNTPYGKIYGEIAEAIYKITGEHTDVFEHSVTHTALNAPFMCEERRAAMLTHVYKLNHSQPKPHTFETDPADAKRIREQGGYASGYDAPEGDWT